MRLHPVGSSSRLSRTNVKISELLEANLDKLKAHADDPKNHPVFSDHVSKRVQDMEQDEAYEAAEEIIRRLAKKAGASYASVSSYWLGGGMPGDDYAQYMEKQDIHLEDGWDYNKEKLNKMGMSKQDYMILLKASE